MANIKELCEERARLQQRISKAKAQIAEWEARLPVVNKEIEEENQKWAAKSRDNQAWFNQG